MISEGPPLSRKSKRLKGNTGNSIPRFDFIHLIKSAELYGECTEVNPGEEASPPNVRRRKRLNVKDGKNMQRFHPLHLMNSMEMSHECTDSTSEEESPPTIRRSKRLQEKKEDVVKEPHSLQVDPPKTRLRLAHGVLQCTTCSTIWNRDDNSAINIRRCMIEWILRQKRPEYLQHP